MKEAIKHSKITFENILKSWALTDQQRADIQSNVDYLGEVMLANQLERQVVKPFKKRRYILRDENDTQFTNFIDFFTCEDGQIAVIDSRRYEILLVEKVL